MKQYMSDEQWSQRPMLYIPRCLVTDASMLVPKSSLMQDRGFANSISDAGAIY